MNVKAPQSHLIVFGILLKQQVQNWRQICNLMREKLHEDFITSNLFKKKKNIHTYINEETGH